MGIRDFARNYIGIMEKNMETAVVYWVMDNLQLTAQGSWPSRVFSFKFKLLPLVPITELQRQLWIFSMQSKTQAWRDLGQWASA